MSNQLSTLSAADIAEFKKLKSAAINALEKSADGWRDFILTMQQIQKRELWRVETKTWHEFLDAVCGEVGKTRRHFYKLLRGEEIRLQLSEKASVPGDTQNAKSLAKTIKTMGTKQLLALGQAPPDKRIEILQKTPVPTEKAIEATAKVVAKKEIKTTDKSTWPKDVNETPIPPPAWPFWERRDEVQPWLSQISAIKCSIEKALKDGDALFAWIGNPAVDFLSSSYAAISNAKLYAVCTDCQGWAEKKGGCQTCHNTGLISKHQWEVCSKSEIKEMIGRGSLRL